MLATQTILIVEDDPATRMMLSAALKKQDYNVQSAENGREGVELFQQIQPDLVLMDMMMPELDGLGAIKAIRANEGDLKTPIFMLTAADAVEDIERAFQAGATDFITKPIKWPLLGARLRYTFRAQQMANELQIAQMQAQRAQKMARLGFWRWEIGNDHLEWSSDIESFIGLKPEQINNITALLSYIDADDQNRVKTAFDAAHEDQEQIDLEFRIHHRQQTRIVHLLGTQADADAPQMEGAFQDITQTREAELLAEHLALHDELTGLPNRKLFLATLRKRIEQAQSQPEETRFAVVSFDINRFTRINDALGVKTGDRVLRQMGRMIRQHISADADLARVDGDEFAVILPTADTEAMRVNSEIILAESTKPLLKDHQEVFATLSAGLAVFPDNGHCAESLLQAAAEAQKIASSQGRHLGTAESIPKSSAEELLRLEHDLRQTLANHCDQFHLVYQPQIALPDEQVIGVEALVRWIHPELGFIPPPKFIGILEELGLIGQLSEWVLSTACQQQQAWKQAGFDLEMSVNISPLEFQDPDLNDRLERITQQSGINRQRLKLEITESVAMQDPSETIELLRQWRQAGFKIAVDDFGIGYSSLEYLLRFPLDTIKIDRAFIKDLVETPGDRAIVRAVTVMAQHLQLATIAEGVETQRQRDYLDAIGIHQLQGYLYAKPLPAEELLNFLRAR